MSSATIYGKLNGVNARPADRTRISYEVWRSVAYEVQHLAGQLGMREDQILEAASEHGGFASILQYDGSNFAAVALSAIHGIRRALEDVGRQISSGSGVRQEEDDVFA